MERSISQLCDRNITVGNSMGGFIEIQKKQHLMDTAFIIFIYGIWQINE